MNLFDTIFYQPIFNLLVFLYNIVPGSDVGVAIILATIVIKLVLLPFSWKMLKAQKSLQTLQPKLQELQKKHKDNKEAIAKATMELYKKEKVNPLSSCLPLLIQLPFLFAVFRVFRDGLNEQSLELVYPFITKPEFINPVSFGLFDLSQPIILLAVLAGLAQFWQSKLMTASQSKTKKDTSPQEKGKESVADMATMMGKQMTYVMPVITVVIGATLPGGLALYWFLFTLLTVLQQLFIHRGKEKNKINDEEAISDA